MQNSYICVLMSDLRPGEEKPAGKYLKKENIWSVEAEEVKTGKEMSKIFKEGNLTLN